MYPLWATFFVLKSFISGETRQPAFRWRAGPVAKNKNGGDGKNGWVGKACAIYMRGRRPGDGWTGVLSGRPCGVARGGGGSVRGERVRRCCGEGSHSAETERWLRPRGTCTGGNPNNQTTVYAGS